MLILISPAKTLDFDTPPTTQLHTQPALLNDSEALIDVLNTYSPADIEKLMKISPKLAELNVERYHQWQRPFNADNAKQALFAFQGDVYTGLQASSLSLDDLHYAQDHLRILSGLYGVLRPLDLMQAYRLEMGTKLTTERGKNLYEFWDNGITKNINNQLKAIDSKTILNLASNEYFSAIKKPSLNAEIISPVFKDYKNGQYKLISFFAKKARGLMSAWVIKNRITEINDLQQFNSDGYQFSPSDSDAHAPVFLRKQ